MDKLLIIDGSNLLFQMFFGMPARNPFSQLPDVYKSLDYLDINYIETTNCEADDMITSYVLSFCDDTDIVISSFDSDFFQLISEHVSILRYRGEKTMIYSSQYIIDKYGIYPNQYAYFKSLVGDTADNIKGVEKIGIKTAASLLRTFGTLENIISNAENIDKPSIKKSIVENTDRIRKNYELIRLEKNQPLPYDKCDLEFINTNKTTTEVLRGIGIK